MIQTTYLFSRFFHGCKSDVRVQAEQGYEEVIIGEETCQKKKGDNTSKKPGSPRLRDGMVSFIVIMVYVPYTTAIALCDRKKTTPLIRNGLTVYLIMARYTPQLNSATHSPSTPNIIRLL